MSLRAMAWAFDQKPGGPSSQALVFLHVANRADPTGLAFPLVDTIAAECEIGNRSVRRALDALDDIGLLERVRVRRSDGNWGGYLYRLPFAGAEPVDPANLPSWTSNTEIPARWLAPIPTEPPVTTVHSPPVSTVRSGTTQGLTAQRPKTLEIKGKTKVKDTNMVPTSQTDVGTATLTGQLLRKAADLDLLEGPVPRLPQERASLALRTIVEEWGDSTEATKAAMTVCAELVATVTGEPIPQPMWGHLGRLVTTQDKRQLAAALAVALEAGAGLTGDHVSDPLALTKYAAAVLRAKATT